MMLEATKRYEIDRILLSSLDRKWSSSKIDQIKRRFRKINKEIAILASDCGQETRTTNGYLPGGTINILLGRVAGLNVKNFSKTDRKGRWSSFRLESNQKTMQVFNIYRIPESTALGILKSRAQYDLYNGEIKISRQYQDELLEELVKEI